MSKLYTEIEDNITRLSKLSSDKLREYATEIITDYDILVKILKVADFKYHSVGTPLITDSQYDMLKDILTEKDPDNRFDCRKCCY